MIVIVSHIASTSLKMWLEIKIVLPFPFISKTKSMKRFCINGSSPEVGSSRTRTSGSFMNAATTANLRLTPKDIRLVSWEGSSSNFWSR